MAGVAIIVMVLMCTGLLIYQAARHPRYRNAALRTAGGLLGFFPGAFLGFILFSAGNPDGDPSGVLGSLFAGLIVGGPVGILVGAIVAIRLAKVVTGTRGEKLGAVWGALIGIAVIAALADRFPEGITSNAGLLVLMAGCLLFAVAIGAAFGAALAEDAEVGALRLMAALALVCIVGLLAIAVINTKRTRAHTLSPAAISKGLTSNTLMSSRNSHSLAGTTTGRRIKNARAAGSRLQARIKAAGVLG